MDCPLALSTDKASLFVTTEKRLRDRRQAERASIQSNLPPTQIGRALRELGITWIAAHSPLEAKRPYRAEFLDRSGSAGERTACTRRAATMDEANPQYLQREFLPWWNQHLGGVAGHSGRCHHRLWARSTRSMPA